MTAFYKATRPDGTDFRTGVIRYEVGKTVGHPTSRKFGDMKPNSPSSYLSVSVEPGEVLLGGVWPCRLFRVEPVGRAVRRTDGSLPYKRGLCALRVVEELPAYLALGPNGREAGALIERARGLTADEARRLDAARDARTAARIAARIAAWDAAWDAAGDVARAAARDAARGAARGAARDAARDASWDAAWDAAWDASWAAARDAAWDAAGAVVVRDLLAPEHFNLLYGPWAEVIG